MGYADTEDILQKKPGAQLKDEKATGNTTRPGESRILHRFLKLDESGIVIEKEESQ